MAKFDNSDDSVVVIIGSGAGGGTLANELCQKGVKVVVLEAGALQSNATFINDDTDVYYNSEIRKSGSPWTRDGGNALDRGKWKVPRDRFFRGREKSTFDASQLIWALGSICELHERHFSH